jgi:putative transposase
MSRANPLWGAPRIHGELQKLGIEISQATVSKYVGRPNRPPSQTWRTFLDNHIRSLVSVDFFTVPTVTFKVLFVFVVLAHHRRRVVHCNVTDAPTAAWTAQQIVEAFPWETAPRYVLRDRDAVYGVVFSSRVQALGIRDVKAAPRSPWQSPYVERLIGTLRRECLDHVVVLNETHLRRLLRGYLIYYHGARTHLSLEKDAPEPRPVERLDEGRIVETPWSAASIIATAGWRRKISSPAGVPATLSLPVRGFPSLPGVLLPSRRPARSPQWAQNAYHPCRSRRPRRGGPDRLPPVVPP